MSSECHFGFFFLFLISIYAYILSCSLVKSIEESVVGFLRNVFASARCWRENMVRSVECKIRIYLWFVVSGVRSFEMKGKFRVVGGFIIKAWLFVFLRKKRIYADPDDLFRLLFLRLNPLRLFVFFMTIIFCFFFILFSILIDNIYCIFNGIWIFL